MPAPVVLEDSIQLLPYMTSIDHRFVELDGGDRAVKTTLDFSGHEFKVSEVSHPPHSKIHGAMVSNINEGLERIEKAIREGDIREVLVDRPGSERQIAVPISFTEKDPLDD